MGLNDDNLKELEQELLKNPQLGDVIEGTGGARKLRIKLGNHGKSGGARIIRNNNSIDSKSKTTN